MNDARLKAFVLEALETEVGGVDIYATALTCCQNKDLKKEWTKYRDQTKEHVEALLDICAQMSIDSEEETPGRAVVRQIGESLVAAMKMAVAAGDKTAAELVACDCVTFAETKDHANWELIGHLAKTVAVEHREILQDVYTTIEEEEDQHLYHTIGWGRELALKALGLPAVLPPPEEAQKVKSAVGAAHAKTKRSKAV